MKKEFNWKRSLIDYTLITLGLFLVAAGVYFFKMPNNFSTGGVSGISILLSAVVPMSKATLMAVINMLLLGVGFIFLGTSFGIRTLYGSVVLSFFVKFFEHLIPLDRPMTDQPLLELVFAVILPAVGSAILFNYSASSGGTDIIAMILKKYTALDIGKALFCTDAIIAVTSGIMFGVTTGLFSVLGLLAKAVVVDNVMEGINVSKYFTIITDRPEEVSEFIHSQLRRGATKYKCIGTYDNKERFVIMSVMNRAQAKQLRDYIRRDDPQAFVIITNSSNILGKGFRTPM
ncbi:YitT family protein [Aminipila luticellarii]|uniref:YitT family protein n=2 Tax=Aminipila luticellarii TaxID=2507160 RepID=A0A410PYI3_9FIRM|nr:YitT family protein [Aminipila luticellarii]QAT44032.1 YitT family protein [Aminipila luticellarii]